MADQQCSSVSSMTEANWFTQVENGVPKKDPSNKRQSFFPSLQIRPCGVRHKSEKNFSSQCGNATTRLLRSSLLKVASTLVVFLEMEAWSPHTWACMRWSAVTWSMFFLGHGDTEPFVVR